MSGLAVLLAGTATVRTFVKPQTYGAASGCSNTCTQQIVTSNGVVVRNEQAQITPVTANANGLVTIPSLTVPVPFSQSTTGVVWMAAMANCDGIDASTNCDAGVCSALIEQTFPLDFHGGQCCVAGGSYCTGVDAALPTSNAVVNINTAPTSSSAPAYGTTLQVSCNSSGAITVAGQAGPNSACNFYGLTSEWQNPNP